MKRYLDTRVEIILLIVIIVIFFLNISLLLLLIYLISVILLLVTLHGFKSFLTPLLGILPLLLFITILTPLFNKSGDILIRIHNTVFLTESGLEDAIRYIIRLSGITLSVFLFYKSVNIEEVLISLQWFGVPFKIALTITVSIQYIPGLLKAYNEIVDAHKLRIPPDISSNTKERKVRYSPFKKLKNLIPVLVATLVYGVKRIPTLAMALEMRGLGRNNKRTSFIELNSGKRFIMDILVGFMVLILFLFPVLITS